MPAAAGQRLLRVLRSRSSAAWTHPLLLFPKQRHQGCQSRLLFLFLFSFPSQEAKNNAGGSTVQRSKVPRFYPILPIQGAGGRTDVREEGCGGSQARAIPNPSSSSLPLVCPCPVLQPEGASEGDVHRLPESRLPHGAAGGG